MIYVSSIKPLENHDQYSNLVSSDILFFFLTEATPVYICFLWTTLIFDDYLFWNCWVC